MDYQLLTSFNDSLEKMKNVDGLLNNVKSFLGTIDADKEWNDNPEDAYLRFLHTKSYMDFLDDDSLILLGRTGTGKTAIIRCISENVNNGKIKNYTKSIIVPFDNILFNLINTVDDFNNTVINNQLKQIISYYINCYIMKSLIEKKTTLQKSAMYKYLRANGLLKLDERNYIISGVNQISAMIASAKATASELSDEVKDIAIGAISVANIIHTFISNGYEDAYDEMVKEIEDQRILVLVDTLDEYDLRDLKIVLSVKALIATCFDYYLNSSKSHIYVKISIPSEIHTQLIEQLPGKRQGNTVVIQWSNNDLIKMIAIRLLHDKIGIFRLIGEYNYEDFYDSNNAATEKAKELIYEFLPQVCPTSLNYTFDTLAYTIRHTLKKPRELITIFNYFISRIYEERCFKFFILNPNTIRDMVHSTQEELISSALSMYAVSYKDILRACEIVLHGQRFYFKGKDLDDKFKEAIVNREYDINDIKRILLESGLLGKINDISYINSPTTDHTSGSNYTIRVIQGKFEYQVKGRLSLNRDDYYVIHPMCYEHFECILGMQTLVYPDEFDDDGDIMKSVRIKEWNS